VQAPRQGEMQAIGQEGNEDVRLDDHPRRVGAQAQPAYKHCSLLVIRTLPHRRCGRTADERARHQR
jgi:hypothetical protein